VTRKQTPLDKPGQDFVRRSLETEHIYSNSHRALARGACTARLNYSREASRLLRQFTRVTVLFVLMDANNEKTRVGQKSGGVIQTWQARHTHARKELVMHINLRRWTALATGGTSNSFAPDHDGLHQCHSAEGDAPRCSTYGNPCRHGRG
jgi:hypothetical protein